jgi:hypothetical protein
MAPAAVTSENLFKAQYETATRMKNKGEKKLGLCGAYIWGKRRLKKSNTGFVFKKRS